MSDTNHAASVELLRAAFKEESQRQLDRLESTIHYAVLAERERHSKMICVLVYPITKKPTAFEPVDDPISTPLIFDGPHQNVAMVTEEWRQIEMARLCSLRADELVAAERERCAKVAEAFDEGTGFTDPAEVACDALAREIATRIRSGE